MSSPLTSPAFVAKWQASQLTERSAAQSHFIDLCTVLDEPAPSSDPTGDFYTFEKGVSKASGGEGWADVWKRGHFAWEYKGKRKDLGAAYQQLLQYKDDLENPPLLVVCDLDRFEVHTNFTNTVKHVYGFALADLDSPAKLVDTDLTALDVLRAVFTQPERLRPHQTAAQVTEKAAAEFAKLAESLRATGVAPEKAAHFLMRLLFCLFAEDIGLLPDSLFTKLVAATKARPDEFGKRLRQLFSAMAAGGSFGYDDIKHFDGGLFTDDEVLDLGRDDMAVLVRACKLHWASVEPAIFGTLFERSLDPSKRGQLGAHYTSRDDILLVVEPVLTMPLRREWAEVQQQVQAILAKRDAATGAARARHQKGAQTLLDGFATRVQSVQVLDPACGSGNFLYVSLKQLMDLEKAVGAFTAKTMGQWPMPHVDPKQLHGIEVNAYAHELASVVVWIGYIQWMHDNGYGIPEAPVLKPLQNIRRMDAILARDGSGAPGEPEWPEADVIVGNPPFLGGKLLRRGLGDKDVDDLFTLYAGRVPHEADLVCYWFEKARALVETGKVKRVGLLATQGIRGGANRRVLERIKDTGDIFLAWADRDWTLDGATVHVSMVGFDDGSERARTLDGTSVPEINADLSSAADLTRARRLAENLGVAFMGDTKVGPFDITTSEARRMLALPVNPNGHPNSDVVRPWVNGLDITRRPRDMYIIDFPPGTPADEAALYETPFGYIERHVKPMRAVAKSGDATGVPWWIHQRPRPDMRAAIKPLPRFAATPRVSKHRLFVFLESGTLPDCQLIVIARADDYALGVLHSRAHELWARRKGTQLREAESGCRYTPTTTFETFPFPWPLGSEPADDPKVLAIVQAARELAEKRDAWLNPPGATEAEKKALTLTNLYNKRPTWLDHLHRTLDAAVLDAYGWPHDLTDDEMLARLLALNLARAAAGSATSSAEVGDADGEGE